MRGGWRSDFRRCWAKAKTLNEWDSALLLVLGMQPSEIERLNMEDYWHWCEVASEEGERRHRALSR